MSIREQDIRTQSEAATRQWGEIWRKNASHHKSFPKHSLGDFENIGIGKAALMVANGASLERNIETIKKYQNNVDIYCCDKSLGVLLDNGIKPKVCIVCDANVNYDRYLKPWRDQILDITLFINACGNPEWSAERWQWIYFFVNKDILESEKIYAELSGCPNIVPAGTNVSNAMVILVTQSDNTGRKNYFGYDKILLIGYDYSWMVGGNYYAFNEDGDGKHQYMRHHYCMTVDGRWAYTSGNLLFSAKWLDEYVKAFTLPVLNCSKDTILPVMQADLEIQMQYKHNPQDAIEVRSAISDLRALTAKKKTLENRVNNIAKDHWFKFMETI